MIIALSIIENKWSKVHFHNDTFDGNYNKTINLMTYRSA